MTVRFSLRFGLLLLTLHVMGATVVYATAMPLEYMAAILLLVTLSLIYYLARDVLLLLPDSWCEIALDQGDVAVVTTGGSRLLGRLARDTIASPCFIVLRVKLEDRYIPVSRIIFPDALSTGAFRELCVRLRFT